MPSWPHDQSRDLTANDSQRACEDQARRTRSNHDLVIGLALFAIGFVITIATYSSASSSPRGGTYIVAWGPMVFGVIRIFKGLASR